MTGLVKVSAHLSRLRDGQTVQGTHGHVDDLLAPQALYHLGLPHVHVGAVAQSEVVAFAPVWENTNTSSEMEKRTKLEGAHNLRLLLVRLTRSTRLLTW